MKMEIDISPAEMWRFGAAKQLNRVDAKDSDTWQPDLVLVARGSSISKAVPG
jgi:hypothetical protein